MEIIKNIKIVYWVLQVIHYVLSNSAFIDFVGSGIRSEFNQYVFENPLDSRYVDPQLKQVCKWKCFFNWRD